ncbi:MAG: methyltransferase domain-containing protein [Alphaproteobacteria bacterium]|nr:methyltransferase domain-containing protein [Alphaproteobacteria bacterium]MCW5739249.1 methyltransferase domain-containing protein [Alphaproteobacteria bacterium]
MTTGDTLFAGSIPALYDRFMGPMLFRPYAADLAHRLADLKGGRLLETAAGTGIVTETLVAALPSAVEIVATDLNQAMVDFAATKTGIMRAQLRRADALSLPFDDGSFDVVVCQFGVMFFPDRVAGYREARRVLKPGGRFLFNAWDSLAHNPLPALLTETLATRFAADPPRFFERTPHGYHDVDRIRADLGAAGFARIAIDTVSLPSCADSAREAATGFCQGSPLRGEIEARAPDGLQAATDAVADALAARYGSGAIEAPMRAHVVTARP